MKWNNLRRLPLSGSEHNCSRFHKLDDSLGALACILTRRRCVCVKEWVSECRGAAEFNWYVTMAKWCVSRDTGAIYAASNFDLCMPFRSDGGDKFTMQITIFGVSDLPDCLRTFTKSTFYFLSTAFRLLCLAFSDLVTDYWLRLRLGSSALRTIISHPIISTFHLNPATN